MDRGGCLVIVWMNIWMNIWTDRSLTNGWMKGYTNEWNQISKKHTMENIN